MSNQIELMANRIERESEKAVLVVFESADRAGNQKFQSVWMPKSQIQIDGLFITAPKWLVSEKLDGFTELFAVSMAAQARAHSN